MNNKKNVATQEAKSKRHYWIHNNNSRYTKVEQSAVRKIEKADKVKPIPERKELIPVKSKIVQKLPQKATTHPITVPRRKQSSPAMVKKASKTLRSEHSSHVAKSLAGSILSTRGKK